MQKVSRVMPDMCWHLWTITRGLRWRTSWSSKARWLLSWASLRHFTRISGDNIWSVQGRRNTPRSSKWTAPTTRTTIITSGRCHQRDHNLMKSLLTEAVLACAASVGEADDVPATYPQAMNSNEAPEWVKVRNTALKGHTEDGSWALVPKKKDVRPIGCIFQY